MERILIIEDETPMRTALADVLEGEGYRSLSEGQVVEFIATQGEKGWQASEVAPAQTA